MPKYDLNDPTDLDIMRAKFNMVSHEEWDDYIHYAEEDNIGYKKTNVLKSASRKSGMAKYLSPKVISWVLDIIDELDNEEEEYEEDEDE